MENVCYENTMHKFQFFFFFFAQKYTYLLIPFSHKLLGGLVYFIWRRLRGWEIFALQWLSLFGGGGEWAISTGEQLVFQRQSLALYKESVCL